ncbi:hypothetical protein [Sulfurimonas sp.]
MIISYIDTDLDSFNYQQRVDSLNHLCDIFFVEIERDIKIITERNPIIIRDLVTFYEPTMFMIDSIKDFPFSPTQIAELIMFMLKHNCNFQSKVESISFEEKHIISVYPTVFKYFRQSSSQ